MKYLIIIADFLEKHNKINEAFRVYDLITNDNFCLWRKGYDI